MTQRPEWQLRSLRRIQWRVTWIFILAFIVAIGIAWLLHIIDKRPVPVGLVIAIPILIVSIAGVNMAYFRGVDDGQTHEKSDERTKHI